MILIKGKSIFYDFVKDGEDTTDSQTCRYYIKTDNLPIKEEVNSSEDIVNEIVLQGELAKVDNTFYLRIKGEDTISLETGYYKIRVIFEDSDNGYADYIFDEDLQLID